MTFSCFKSHDIFLDYIFIDWKRDAFIIPLINHPVTWYGILFAISFFLGFFLTKKIVYKYLKNKFLSKEFSIKESLIFTDRLTIFVILGAVIGARLGHVFFYDWFFYKNNPEEIFKIWQGGLASHGGVIGILIAIGLFVYTKTGEKIRKWQEGELNVVPFLFVLDILVIPGAFAGGLIRIGNFINGEILGKPTDLPWGILFAHPAQHVESLPLHPVQIYESLIYFITGFFLIVIWLSRKYKIGDGVNSSLFFLVIFSSRFFIEFLKLPQSDSDGKHFLNMGQILSLPFILAGGSYLIFYFFRRKTIGKSA